MFYEIYDNIARFYYRNFFPLVEFVCLQRFGFKILIIKSLYYTFFLNKQLFYF